MKTAEEVTMARASIKKALLLVSGGIDSPVAGKILQEQNIEIIGLHLSNEPFTNNEPELKAKASLKKIRGKRLITINTSKFLSEIASKCSHKAYFVLAKRLFYRIAEQIAEQENCGCIATGENLGQVSSQTLSNLCVIQKATAIPVLQPLLAYDKSEIIKKAEEIGTFELSKGPEMCAVLGPKNPATNTSSRFIEKEEQKLNYEGLLKECLSTKKIEEL
ncbi:MAG: hypothetical protein V1659_03545 [Candidatus Woesearchaeota archaeon]